MTERLFSFVSKLDYVVIADNVDDVKYMYIFRNTIDKQLLVLCGVDTKCILYFNYFLASELFSWSPKIS